MGSTLYTERNSSIVDMRWVCLIFICAALVNFCSLASLNERLGPLTHGLRYKRAASDDEYVYEDVPVWVPPPGFVHPMLKPVRSRPKRSPVTQPPTIWDLRPRPYPVRRSARRAVSDDDFSGLSYV